jgi:5-methylcytosine-specific restriction protein A
MAAPLPKRKPLTKAQRVRVFDGNGGECHICNLPIKLNEKWEADHIIARWKKGRDIAENYAPAHVRCHALKSGEETTQRAKADRVRAKHIGATIPPPRPLKSRGFPRKAPKPEKQLPPRRSLYTESST